MFPPSSYFSRLGILFVGALLTVLTIQFIDFPVAQWCYQHPDWPKPFDELRDIIQLLEIFGHVTGVILLLIALPILDADSRKWWGRIVGMLALGALASTLVKLSIVRYRPRFFFSDDFIGVRDSVWDSFGGLFFRLHEGGNLVSFPSGHSAMAFAIATVLAWRYPHGRWFFYVLALGVAVQRIVCSAHFPSDTVAGAVLGLVAASLLIPASPSKKQLSTLGR